MRKYRPRTVEQTNCPVAAHSRMGTRPARSMNHTEASVMATCRGYRGGGGIPGREGIISNPTERNAT